MAVTDHVVLEKDGDVARVWLNRPHKKNAVTVELLHRLDEIIREVDSDPDLRVLILRGREGTFCSGFDLDELLADYVGTTTAMEVAVLSAKVCDRLYSMNTPSVAVLEGFVTAGGFELMISCDFAVSADDAQIGDFHIRRALFGGAGPIYRLPRYIGLRKTKELLFTGEDRVPADEALRIGLVNRVVPAVDLDAATLALADEIAKNEPFVVQTTKRAVNRAWDVAGFRAAMAANTELDVMIETANLPARDEFRRITEEQGLKAAIAWRDARYRGES